MTKARPKIMERVTLHTWTEHGGRIGAQGHKMTWVEHSHLELSAEDLIGALESLGFVRQPLVVLGMDSDALRAKLETAEEERGFLCLKLDIMTKQRDHKAEIARELADHIDVLRNKLDAAGGLAEVLENLKNMIDDDGPPSLEWRAISAYLETNVTQAIDAWKEDNDDES